MSLRKQSLDALFWSAIDTVGRQGIQFLTSVLLARLLSPAEFGLMGMTSIFLAVASTFVDSGFSAALIQRKVISENDTTAVFYFNVGTAALVSVLLWFCAPLIADFYHEPVLTGLTRLLTLNLVISSLGAIQNSLLNKQINFKTPWKIGMAANVVSGGAAIWLAFRGFGVWSLAIQGLVSSAVTTILFWILVPWRPSWSFSWRALAPLFRFGSRLLASTLLNSIFERVQLLLIGKFFSPQQLGYYTRAYGAQQFPTASITSILSKVTFPVFSKIADDPARLQSAVRLSILSVMAVVLPALTGLAVLAEPFVRVVFGEKWLPCVAYLQILAFAGVLWPLHSINLSVLTASGRSDLFLRAEIIKKIVFLAALAISVTISVLAMVWANLIVSVLCFLVNAWFARGLIGYGALRQTLDLGGCISCTALMAGGVWLVNRQFQASPLTALIAGTCAGILIYVLAGLVLRVEAHRQCRVVLAEWL